MTARSVTWSGVEGWQAGWRAEHAELEIGAEGMRASGVQLGIDPQPYRCGYVVITDSNWVTRSLVVEAMGAGWSNRLEASHDGEGHWSYTSGGDPAEVEGALDCDIAFSPLTNLMPVRRHRLHEQPGTVDFSMAWISVPDVQVQRSEQRYEHLRTTDDGSVVRYRSIGEGEDFVADLELDSDGLVVVYPQLARQVAG